MNRIKPNFADGRVFVSVLLEYIYIYIYIYIYGTNKKIVVQ